MPTSVSVAKTEPPLVLALDFGSSSVRACAFDRRGRAVEGLRASRDHTIQQGTDGSAELDADQLLEQAWSCLDEALASAHSSSPGIAAVAISSFASTVVGVDRSGRAVTPLILYADTRAAREVARLRKRLDEASFHQRTGCRFHTSYLPAQLLWIERSRPEWLERSAQWLPLSAYLSLQLFGEARVSYSVASWTGLLDRTALRWDDSLLDLLPIGSSHLPTLCDADAAWEGLHPPFADRWPALRGARWFPAIGDGAAANLGSGCTDARRMAVTIGTSSAVRVVVPDTVDRVPPGLWCYRVDGRRSLLGGALNEGGNVFAWARQTLRLEGGPEMEAAVAKLPPGGHGLTFLPLLAGERSPGWEGAMRGALTGLSLTTTPAQVLRAALEGVVFRIARVCDQLRPALPAEPEVVASGGALSHSATWLQILADVLGRPVKLSAAEEVSARGAALLALEALGQARLSDFEATTAHVFEPEASRHQVYARAMRRQQALYDHLLKGLREEGDVRL